MNHPRPPEDHDGPPEDHAGPAPNQPGATEGPGPDHEWTSTGPWVAPHRFTRGSAVASVATSRPRIRGRRPWLVSTVPLYAPYRDGDLVVLLRRQYEVGYHDGRTQHWSLPGPALVLTTTPEQITDQVRGEGVEPHMVRLGRVRHHPQERLVWVPGFLRQDQAEDPVTFDPILMAWPGCPGIGYGFFDPAHAHLHVMTNIMVPMATYGDQAEKLTVFEQTKVLPFSVARTCDSTVYAPPITL